MEMTLNNGFCEMSQDESMTTEGGIGLLASCAIGFVGGVLVDGVVIAATGQSCGEWVADGINAGINAVKNWF